MGVPRVSPSHLSYKQNVDSLDGMRAITNALLSTTPLVLLFLPFSVVCFFLLGCYTVKGAKL